MACAYRCQLFIHECVYGLFEYCRTRKLITVAALSQFGARVCELSVRLVSVRNAYRVAVDHLNEMIIFGK